MPYDFTNEVTDYAKLLVQHIEPLSHIDTTRVMFGITISRKGGRYGTYAACHPLRFEGGEQRMKKRGRVWEWPSVKVGGVEMLYYVDFYVPRYLDLPRAQKIETVVHELYHISPYFNGDLRRLGTGRHAYHGPSREYYDRLISPYVQEAGALAKRQSFAFLETDFSGLRAQYGAVTGRRARRLRPVHVAGGI